MSVSDNGLAVTPEKYPPFKPGTYKLKLLEVIPAMGKWKPIFHLVYEITEEGDLKGRKVRGLVNQDPSIGGKLWQVYRAMTGDALKQGDKIFPERLVGKECFAEVEHRGRYNAISEYISPKNLAGIERNNISR